MNYELDSLIAYNEPVDAEKFAKISGCILRLTKSDRNNSHAKVNINEMEVLRRCCALMCDVVSNKVSVGD